MNEQEQIEALAELDGFEPLPEGHFHPDYPIGQRPPPYLTSRDAIIPVIERQSSSVKIVFIRLLHSMCDSYHNTALTDVYCVLATPKQLAEAFLRATGKWKETNKDLAPLFGADLD